MKTSTSIIKIAPALLAAQKKMGAAKKDAINPFFHSNYADLGSVMEVCKEPLNEQGIAILQPLESDEHGVYVETVLLHESGEWMSAGLRIAPKSETNPQDQGSAISYARRYGLQSFGFIPAEDDDAEKAAEKATVRKIVSHPVANTALKTMVTTSSTLPICSIHDKEMKKRTTQAGGHYYDHRWQRDSGEWQKCNGKPKVEESEESDGNDTDFPEESYS
jgi:hypothetical protein